MMEEPPGSLPGLVLPVRLDPYGSRPSVPSVVDADALLASVRNHCQTGWQSRLSRLGESGRWPLFASMHVYAEVYRRLSKVAIGSGVSVDELRERYETDYLPYISWVQVAPGYGHDPRVGQITDHTDVPSGCLASMIAPCTVYAEDRSLRRPGFSSAQWRDVAGSAINATEARRNQEVLVTLGGMPVMGTFKGSAVLSRRLQMPGWVGVLAVFGVAAWGLWPEERRQKIGRALLPLVEMFGEFMAAEQRALAGVRSTLFHPVEHPPTKAMIATVLARADEPLLAADLRAELVYRFGARAPALTEVRRVLKDEPEFVTRLRSRWQLGYRAAPLADERWASLLLHVS